MAIVLIQMPSVNPDPSSLPRLQKCPNPQCNSEILQRWGIVSKPLRDTEWEEIQVYRYRCIQCKHTFRHYPEGVDKADQSKRLRCLAAMAWSMGLSLRGVGTIFSAFGQGLGIGRSSVWRARAVQEMAAQLRSKAHSTQHKHKVRVLGVDGAWIRLNGESTGVMVAVDMGDGQLVSMEVLDEHDPQAVSEWLRPMVAEFGVEVIVTDDLTTYNTVEEELGVERQLCYFHMRRWVGKSLLDLEKKLEVEESWPDWPPDWPVVIEEVKQLVEEMPPKGDERLLELWQQVQKECGYRKRREEDSPLQKLARLILQLTENWRKYRLYLTEKGAQLGQLGVPATNNLTEQMIGNGKICSRTVRGYKSKEGVLAAFLVCAARFA